MKYAAVCIVAVVVCSGAFASEPGQPLEDLVEKAKQTTEEVNAFIRKYEQAQEDESDKLFRRQFSLWKNVKCVVVDTPEVTGSDVVRNTLSTDRLRDVLILRLASDLPFPPLCQGDPYAMPKGTVAHLNLFVDTAGAGYPVAYTTKLAAVILYGATLQADCSQDRVWRSDDWQADPQLGFGHQVNLREIINRRVKEQVETLATFMARVRSTDFGNSDSSMPQDK